MTRFFRRLHLFLALVSSAFLLMAAISGTILSFQSVKNEWNKAHFSEFKEKNVGTLIKRLDSHFEEIIEIKKTNENTIYISAFDEDYNNIEGILNPKTFEVSSAPKEPFFTAVTAFHRSLFIGSTGRAVVAVCSIVLVLIVLTGLYLIVKRQVKVSLFFGKIKEVNTTRRRHIRSGRLAFPILLLTASTACVLSAQYFGFIDKDNSHIHSIPLQNQVVEESSLRADSFEVFKTVQLSQFINLSFPFSSESDDFYLLETKEGLTAVNQFNGELIQNKSASFKDRFLTISFNLHTGKGSVFLALILGFGSLSIVYFVFSGVRLWISSRKNQKDSSSTDFDKARLAIFYGSETGSAKAFADHLYQSVIVHQKYVYYDTLNNYQKLPNIEQLILVTSTYGNGEAPKNATRFMDKYQANLPGAKTKIYVVGFGSKNYPLYCNFAKDISRVSKKSNQAEIVESFINNHSEIDLQNAVQKISKLTSIPILPYSKSSKLVHFRLKEKRVCEESNTIVLVFNTPKKCLFHSGDLLSLTMKVDEKDRFYSLAKLDENEFLISVKLHDKGKCSSYLNTLKIGDRIVAKVISTNFKVAKACKELVYISNGTGLAPFLGFQRQLHNSLKVTLFWGGKGEAAFDIYHPYLLASNTTVYKAYSQDNQLYIQNVVEQNRTQLLTAIENGAHILICGSIGMCIAVLEIIDKELSLNSTFTIDDLLENKVIQTDCY